MSTSLKHFFSAGYLLACAFTLQAQAGEQAALAFDIKGVTEIEMGGGSHIHITQGDTESLRVQGDKEWVNRVVVDQTGSKLTLSIKQKTGKGWHLFDWVSYNSYEESVDYFVQVKSLTKLQFSGAVNAELGEFTLKNLAIYASGATEMHLANLTAEDLYMEFSGASNLHAQKLSVGKMKAEFSGAANMDIKTDSLAKFVVVEASGASNFWGKLLVAEQADMGASGASNIEIHAANFLRANASGASNIHYRGQPKLDSHTSGASNVNALGN